MAGLRLNVLWLFLSAAIKFGKILFIQERTIKDSVKTQLLNKYGTKPYENVKALRTRIVMSGEKIPNGKPET